MTLTTNELFEMKGGISLGLVTAIIGAVSFIAGFIDGFLNPLKCRK